MKFFIKVVLALFIVFLSKPTVVALIKKNSTTSLFYSFAEGETFKDLKEIKADAKQYFDNSFFYIKILKNTSIISKNVTSHDTIACEIFLIPPELI